MDDRHGRCAPLDRDPRRRPPGGYRLATARRFSQLVEDTVAGLPAPLRAPATRAVIAVEAVPPVQEAVRPAGEGDTQALVRYEAGHDGGRLVVYRRALEAHCTTRDELADLLRSELLAELRAATGMREDDEDPDGR